MRKVFWTLLLSILAAFVFLTPNPISRALFPPVYGWVDMNGDPVEAPPNALTLGADGYRLRWTSNGPQAERYECVRNCFNRP